MRQIHARLSQISRRTQLPRKAGEGRELGAYEALWDKPETTFKTLSEKFAARPHAVPSDFVSPKKAHEYAEFVRRRFREAEVTRFGVRVHGAGEYPQKLRDAANPIELLYYQGWWDLAESRSVAVVGTRTPTADGIARAARLVKALVKDDFTIVSGLAAGIDTVAHETAIAGGGRTIAVIGTPLSHTYPKENAELQRKIASEYLTVSQVPVRRYERQDYRKNRLFFPERNITMSARVRVWEGATSSKSARSRSSRCGPRCAHSNCFGLILKGSATIGQVTVVF
jgi:DNA processing protein